MFKICSGDGTSAVSAKFSAAWNHIQRPDLERKAAWQFVPPHPLQAVTHGPDARPERQGCQLRQQSMNDLPEIELSTVSDMELVEFDHSVPGWLLIGLGAITFALGLLLYFSY